MQNDRTQQWILGTLAVLGLVIVFLFQGYDLAGNFGVTGKTTKFLINRSIRFLINDGLAILLIYSLFKKRKFLVFSLVVQLAGMVFILIPYFILKVYYPSYNGPLISFLHRLVLNPTLLLILIPAFYYQQRNIKQENPDEAP